VPPKLLRVLIALLVVGGNHGEEATGRGNAMPPFEVGQVWTYYTRPGEEASRIIICRIETDAKLGQIVHIHVNGLRLKNKHAPAGSSDQIGHMPYSSEALRQCVTKLESTDAVLPAFEDGYQEWRTAFDNGKAGVWTAPVSDAIAGMESVLTELTSK
jgi:hypothetical protein